MPHNPSLTDSPLTPPPHNSSMWLPPPQTQAKVNGSRNQKESEAHHIHMLPLLSRLSSVLVICQRKEILKAILI